MIGKFLKISDLSTSPSRKRATVLQALGGYVNTGIVVAQGLLLIPLYLYYIEVHTYGLWLASGGILGMLGLVNFGISGLLVQRVSREYAQQNFSQAGAYFINGALIYLVICLLFATAGWAISNWLPAIFKMTGEEPDLLTNCFQLAVVALVIGVFNECLRSFCQALLRPVIPVVSMVVGRLIGVFVTVWMLFNSFGLWSIPVGALITEGFIFITNLVYASGLFYKLESKMKLDRYIIKEFLRTSPILLMARTGNTLSQESEPLLITLFLSPEITTAYMVTRRAADIVFRLLNVIVGSTMSSFAHLAGHGDVAKINNIAQKLLMLSFSIGVIGFATYVGANHAFVSLWVGESFALDLYVILFIALGFLARTLRGLIAQMLFGLGSFMYPSVIILIEGVFRIILAAVLLNLLGVVGVPIAFALSCLFGVVVLGLRLIFDLKMYFDFFSVFRLFGSGVVLFGVGVIVNIFEIEVTTWVSLLLLLVMLFCSVFVIYAAINWSKCREIYRDIVS